jgi:putative sterol carrier protein
MERCCFVKARGLLFCLTMPILMAQVGLTGLHAAEPENSVPQDVFDGMRESFRPEKAIGIHARYQFELSGPAGGWWWIEVNNGTSKIGRGKINNPNVTFITSDRDWVALSNGHLSGLWATLSGRLKVRGDQRLARKLDEMFP